MISVQTSFDSPYKPVADLTIPIMQEYCDRHDYEFQVRQNPVYPHGLYWGRVDDLMNYQGLAEWTVHLDADVLITNLTIPLTEILTGIEQPIATGQDHNGINDGFLAVRTKDRHILNKFWETSKADCLQTSLVQSSAPYEVHCLPQRRVNSYAVNEYPNEQNPEGQWQKGDFILHMPGRTNQRRIELIHQHLSQIIR